MTAADYPLPTPTAPPYASPYVIPGSAAPRLRVRVTPRRDRRRPFRYTLTGTVQRPAEVTAVQGCRGRVVVVVRRRGVRKPLAAARIPVRANCSFRAKLVLSDRAGRRGRATVTSTFRGNDVLRRATRRIGVRFGA